VSEGIADENGTAIASLFIKEKDSHGNLQLSGTGALGDMLSGVIREKADISRVRADTFGYLQRSFPAIVSPADEKEAMDVGAQAVKAALKFASGSIAIRRKPGKTYKTFYERVELQQVAKETKHVPDAFINRAGNDVTPAFLAYAGPIVGKLPVVGRFKGVKVAKAR
jgi:6-phosphofructokinase 1